MSSGSSHYPSRNSKRDKLAECLVLVRRLTLSSFQILCHPPSNSSMRPYTWFKRCKSKLKHLIHLFTYHLPNLSSWTILYGSSPLWFCALWMIPCFFWCSQTCVAREQNTAHDEQLSDVDETDVLQSIWLNIKERISDDFTLRMLFFLTVLFATVARIGTVSLQTSFNTSILAESDIFYSKYRKPFEPSFTNYLFAQTVITTTKP